MLYMSIVQKFLNYLSLEKRYSKHTIRSYKTDLALYQQHLDSTFQVTPQKATNKMIRTWLVSELEKGNTARSVNRKISTLKSFYKYATKNKIIQKNPTLVLSTSKASKKIPSFLSQDEINQLLDNYKFKADYQGERDRLMIELFYSTGIRLSELINIRLKDIDIPNGQLKVVGKRNKERIIPLTNELVNTIPMFIKTRKEVDVNDTPYLLLTNKGLILNPSMVYRTINKLLSSVSSLKNASPHVLRHTFATHMLNSGADLNVIKELLGHASLSATEVYTHNSIEKLKNVYNNAHPRA